MIGKQTPGLIKSPTARYRNFRMLDVVGLKPLRGEPLDYLPVQIVATGEYVLRKFAIQAIDHLVALVVALVVHGFRLPPSFRD